ncbi:putative aldouronate transport system permease protein [Paenibacillus sp. UNCCL117]|uniref:carbohydrate ABC transporter permease n=1 Tax=unclassified Paenibacillus TaxID=185978 RepID=UPI00088D14A0|nr:MULTISPECIES: carbohydrate ABC transporter permease [unclassified Paenibacillus]SDE44943.1 putative aldouronate transport system permease protein [Paenibacillus sp. cl123]SFW46398.1 putative aldouronate transport system permease protein [Paenibacillus sp. UNCCL117]
MIKRISLFDTVNVLLLLIFSCAMLFPFLHMAAVSLSSSSFITANQISIWPKGFNFDAYATMLQDKRIYIGYRNTLLYVVLGTSLSLFFTTIGAYALSRTNLIFGKSVMMLIVFTMLFSGGMIPTYLVVRSYGLLDTIWAMVLPGLVSSYYLVVMRTFFLGIPKELEESGKIDGLSDTGILTKIILPLSKPVLLTIGLFYAVQIWSNFFSALIYIRNANLYPLQVTIRNIVLIGQVTDATVTEALGNKQVPLESLKYAVILFGTLPILCVYPFIQKHFEKGAMLGSVKG